MHRRLSEVDSEKLANELAGLERLSGEKLNQHFKIMYRADPPPRMRRALLIQALAYRLQEKALGGLKPATRRLLASAADDAAARRTMPEARERKIKPGTILLREWHGVQHRLTVLEDGVQFGGQRYRSLSEVARKITGSRWSGPLFFGLKSAGPEHHHGAN
jgi:Protein of unknown function (DUF2924)